MDLDGMIQTVLMAILVPVAIAVGGLAVALLNKLRIKMGLQADAEQDAKVRAAVQNAILSTEERLRAEALKRLRPTSNIVDEKMSATTTKVVDAVPGITRAEAEQLVTEELPKLRAASPGADVVALPPSSAA